jgi:hypothetical protein
MWQHLTLYPSLPSARRSQILRDVLVLVLLAFFVWVGVKVHDLVAALAVLGHGITETGTSVQGAFDNVGNAVANVPIVGGALGDAFHGAGDGTGGNLADLGREGEDAVYLLARTLGIVTALLPISVLLVAVLPRRIRVVREMSSARAVSGIDLADPERRRLLAMRAAFGLPYRELLPWTKDPFGDLASGDYDALVAAALADVGLRVPKDYHAITPRPSA